MKTPLLSRRIVVLAFAIPALLHGADRKVVIDGRDSHYIWAFSDEALGLYRKAGPNVEFVVARTNQQLAAQVKDADAVVGGISRELFPTAAKLKWVQTYSAGVENYAWTEFVESPIVLTNCKIVQGPNIADHAFALLLALTRGINFFVADKEKQEWNRDAHELQELPGMTAVILGVGGIGTQIAERAHAFGMKVIGVDPKDIAPGVTLSRIVTPDRLDTVLPEADVVFVAAPLTAESRHMMGARQFELMKKNSYLIAVSRGGLYDTNALVKALDSKKLAGAGLDVTEPEPLPKNHPLWKFPNVVITPHVAGNSPGSWDRRRDVVRENILRFVRGEPLRNVVDKKKGY